MNKIFKIVWNVSTQSWVAVSELSKTKTKTAGKVDKRILLVNLSKLAIATGAVLSSSLALSAVSAQHQVDNNAKFSVGLVDNQSPNGVAVGINVTTQGTGKIVAIGQDVFAGYNTDGNGASSYGATVVGYNSSSLGNSSVAVGANVLANGEGAIAMGHFANGTGFYSMALGAGTETSGQFGVALGANAKANGINNIAIGKGANATTQKSAQASDAIAVGTGAISVSEATVAVGRWANASGARSVAVGQNALVAKSDSVAVGNGAATTLDYSVAIGRAAFSDQQGVALGWAAKAPATSGIAIGQQAETANVTKYTDIGNVRNKGTDAEYYAATSSTAIGRRAKALESRATAIGRETEARDLGSQAIGYKTISGGVYTNVFGSESNVSGNGTTALGNLITDVTGVDTVILGSNVQSVSASNATVIGSNINSVTKDGGVVLGNASTENPYVQATDAVLAGNVKSYTYSSSNWAGNNKTGTLTEGNYVSVGSTGGERQIKNVAAGTINASSTDAINGSQLYWVMDRVENSGWNLTTSNKTGTNGFVSGTSDERISPEEIVTFEAGYNINITQAGNKVTIETTTKPVFENLNLTSGGNTVNLTPTANGLNVSKADGSPANIDNVADGEVAEDSKQAINGSQLYQTITQLTEKGLDFLGNDDALTSIHKKLGETLSIVGGVDKAQKATTTDKNTYVDNEGGKLIVKFKETPEFKGVNLTDGTNTVNLTPTANGLNVSKADGSSAKIDNVEDGDVTADSKQAVNGSQLYATNQEIAKGWNLTTSKTGTGDVQGTTEERINMGELVTVEAGNNINITQATNKITIATSSKPTFESVNLTSGGNTVNLTPTANGLNVSKADGSSAKIDNVAEGNVAEDSKQAINGSQLYYTITNLTAKGLDFLGNDDALTSIHKKLGETLSIVGGVAVADKASVTDKNTYVDNLNGKLIVKFKETPEFKGVNLTDGTNTVNLTPTANGLNVSKADGSPATIDNVADGDVTADSKQAVNGSQLYATQNNLIAKGLTFTGDNESRTVHKKLGETLTIQGNLDDSEPVTDENLRVDAEDNKLVVKMAKSLTDLTNATFTNGDVKTVVGDNGVTVTNVANPNQTPVRLTEKGLDNGNNVITNVSAGVNPTDAVNVRQLEAVNSTVNSGWKLSTNGDAGNASTVNPVTNRVDLSNTDGNINISQNGNNVVFNLNPNTTFGGNGKDGEIGVKGADGKNGVSLNGKDGSIGINGKDGSNASITVADRQTTLDPADGGNNVTRMIYNTTRPVLDENGNPKKDADGNPITEIVERQVATMDDGLNFIGDKGGKVAKKLGETLTIKGNVDVNAPVTDKNLRVDNEKGSLILKMAKSLTDLTNATFTNGDVKTVVGDNGITVSNTANPNQAPVRLTEKGLDNGNNTITNVAPGVNGTDAVNVNQLKQVSDVANAGWTLTTNNGATSSNVKPSDKVDLSNTDGNINISQNGNNVVFNLNPNTTFGGNGKDGEIGVKGADGKNGVSLNGKDGSIGINGKDGSNASITVADRQTTIDNNDGGKNITRMIYNTTRPVLDENGNPKKDANGNPITENVERQVATMDDGLVFAGDKGETAQKLGTKLTVTGGETDSSKLSDKPNIGVIAKDGKLSVQLAKNINLGDNSKVQTGNVSISSDGINAGGKKVSNIADGELSPNSKDAVNGSQLHATNQNVSKVQNEVAKGWHITTSKSGTGNVKGTSVANVKMGDTATVDAGNNINITQSGRKISIATSSKPTFETVTATQSVNIGQGNNAVNLSNDKAGNLVINQGKKPAQIKGVAAGTADTDAVNVAQLKGVNNHINNVNKKLRGGIASAAASGGIPQVYIPGKSMVGAAATAYKGASAVAVGYSRASDNGKVILKVSGSANTQGEMLGTVGVGYQW